MENCDHVDHKGAAPVPAVTTADITFTDGAKVTRELCEEHATELRSLWARGANGFGSIAQVVMATQTTEPQSTPRSEHYPLWDDKTWLEQHSILAEHDND